MNNTFEEEKLCKPISDLLGLKSNTWYIAKETLSTEYTYSVVELMNDKKAYYCPEGKTGLLIGVNPHGNSEYDRDVLDYLIEKKANPSLRHRKTEKDALENTRRNALIDMLTMNIEQGVKKLITCDLFAERTYTSGELKLKIKDNQGELEKIIGNKNKEFLLNQINDSQVDVIILAWGNDGSNLLGEAPDYCSELYEHLYNEIEKIWWYGANKDGSPKHIAYRKQSDFRRIKEEELRKIFENITCTHKRYHIENNTNQKQ